MSLDRVFNVATLIVVSSIVFILVSHQQTAAVINAVGGSFTGSIKAAQGR